MNNVNNIKQLSAIYYPYPRCINDLTLKHAILIFDELWFIDNLTDNQRKYLMRIDTYDTTEGEFTKWNQTIGSEYYKFLSEKRFTNFFNPSSLIKENDLLLKNSFESDINDKDFKSQCKFLINESKQKWNILEDRIPPSILEFIQTVLIRKQPDSKDLLRRINFSLRKWGVEKYKNNGDWLNAFWYNSPEDPQLSFLYGSSIYLNQALLSCEYLNDKNKDLILFTDSNIHHKLIQLKYKRVFNINDQSLKNIILKRTPIDLQKLTVISINLLNEIVPYEIISEASLNDIWNYREKNKESLNRYRNFLFEFTSEIESKIWEGDFEREFFKYFDRKVKKKIQQLEEDLRDATIAFWGDVIKKSTILFTPTILASIYTGMSSGDILKFGSTALGATTALLAPKFIDLITKKRKIKRNFLTYLLDFPTQAKANRINQWLKKQYTIHKEENPQALIKKLQAKNEAIEVRKAAAYKLSKIVNEKTVNVLIETTYDFNKEVRESAVHALEYIEPKLFELGEQIYSKAVNALLDFFFRDKILGFYASHALRRFKNNDILFGTLSEYIKNKNKDIDRCKKIFWDFFYDYMKYDSCKNYEPYIRDILRTNKDVFNILKSYLENRLNDVKYKSRSETQFFTNCINKIIEWVNLPLISIPKNVELRFKKSAYFSVQSTFDSYFKWNVKEDLHGRYGFFIDSFLNEIIDIRIIFEVLSNYLMDSTKSIFWRRQLFCDFFFDYMRGTLSVDIGNYLREIVRNIPFVYETTKNYLEDQIEEDKSEKDFYNKCINQLNYWKNEK